MIVKDWKKEILTIPNLLSLFRLVLIPVYVVIYLQATERAHYFIAGGILAVSTLTDLIDGKIARRFNMISNVGKVLDPIADKLTQFTLMLCLALNHPVAKNQPVIWIIFSLFVLKEIFQLVAMCVFLRKGKMLSGALLSGKICTAVLFVSLIALVLMPDIDPKAAAVLSVVNGGLLLIAFVHYALTYFRQTSKIQNIPQD